MKFPIFAISLLLLLSASTASGATYYVPDNYANIQDAVNACVDGDSVIVRAGTYYENIDFLGKAVTLVSEDGPSTTIIDGMQAGSVVVFQNSEDEKSVLEGFTITNGTGTTSGSFVFGGGIYCFNCTPTISFNVVTQNSVDGNGGGIHCDWASAKIQYNVITDNWSLKNGGGVHCFWCAPLIDGNIIQDNWAEEYYGGGIALDNSSPVITNNMVLWNTAYGSQKGYGGGLFCSRSSPTVTNNTFYDNDAKEGGGAHIRNESHPSVMNSIFWNNNAPKGKEICLAYDSFGPNSSLYIDYSDVEGGLGSVYVDSSCSLYWGTNMITLDPLFEDPMNGDLHLTGTSPCYNTGNNLAPGITDRDFEGDPRIVKTIVDMGADEFTPFPRLHVSPHEIMSWVGGKAVFHLEGGSAYANYQYVLLGSVSGHFPGTPLPGGDVLPLNMDPVTMMLLSMGMPFPNIGKLNSQGDAYAVLVVMPFPLLFDLPMTFAYAANKKSDWKASNHVVLTLTAPLP